MSSRSDAGRPPRGEPSPAAETETSIEAPDGPEPSTPQAESGSLEQRFARRTQIRAPVRHNPKLAALLDRVNEDTSLYALWVATNVTSVDRLGMTDHGPVHVQIVMNSALRILRLLIAADVQPAIVRDYGMTNEDAEVVVALAALLHDVGMAIHRDGHEAYSLFVAQPILESLLADVYEPPADTIVRSEVLHAIISHRSGGSPLTLEGGILRIADALDMAQGRSRIPFEAGSTSIHSVSAAAIEAVNIEAGETTPVRITIQMSNSAGVFQVDDLLRKKLGGSGIEEHIEVEAVIERPHEKQLVRRIVL